MPKNPNKTDVTIADLNLSASEVQVGFCNDGREEVPSLWLQTEDNSEPIYMSVAGCKMLIAALSACVDAAESNGMY